MKKIQRIAFGAMAMLCALAIFYLAGNGRDGHTRASTLSPPARRLVANASSRGLGGTPLALPTEISTEIATEKSIDKRAEDNAPLYNKEETAPTLSVSSKSHPQGNKKYHPRHIFQPPAITHFLVVGTDHNHLADAIIIGAYHLSTGTINVASVPRDLYTYIPDHRLQQMENDGLRPPQQLKINAMRAYGGRHHGVPYLKAQLEDLLGITFDYHIEMRLDAFKKIVDAIGGITMEITQDLEYNDPCQDLYIHIPKGVHHLDGHMAEGVVRYRSFPTGDLGRNAMQMEFIRALFTHLTTTEALMHDPLALISVLLREVNTNLSVINLAKYLPYVGKLENINTFILPGQAQYINGVSWFIVCEETLPEMRVAMFSNTDF